MHPVHIPPQRIDLTVVDHEAVRVGTLPARERVRAETGVNEGNCRLQGFILQIQVELAYLLGCQHAFVYNLAAGHAWHIKGFSLFNTAITDSELCTLTDYKQLAFKGQLISKAFRTADKHLAYIRLGSLSGFTQHFIESRHITVAKHRLSFFRNNLA
ncbi:hypothetical protein D3C80_1441040 [compost metagenome]